METVVETVVESVVTVGTTGSTALDVIGHTPLESLTAAQILTVVRRIIPEPERPMVDVAAFGSAL